MRHALEDVAADVNSKTAEQTEQGASMERVLAVLRALLTAFLDERLTAGRLREQVVKQGGWII